MLSIVTVSSTIVPDESMAKLFNNGEGKLYDTVTSWLNSTHLTLRAAGALAVANFARKGTKMPSFHHELSEKTLMCLSCARSDHNCVLLVSRGIHNELLQTLRGPGEGSINVQHAVFGALRNLAIPR